MPAHGVSDAQTVLLALLAIAVLSTWIERLAPLPVAAKLVSALKTGGTPVTEMGLDKSSQAKPLKGFGGAGVLEVVEDNQGDTYRAVYTVRYAGAV